MHTRTCLDIPVLVLLALTLLVTGGGPATAECVGDPANDCNANGVPDECEIGVVEVLVHPVAHTGSSGGAVHPVDLDGDGDLDLLYSRELILFENLDGDGTFAAGVALAGAVTDLSARIADVDLDGDPDIVAGTYGGEVAWYANDGLGSFGPKQIIVTPNLDYWFSLSFDVGDVDGNGLPDLVWKVRQDTGSGPSPILLNWRRNTGGSFEWGWGLPGWEETDVVLSVHIADLDGDGAGDVYGASSAGVFWHENLDGTQFSEPMLIDNAGTGPIAADLDGDGNLDIVTGEGWNRSLGGGVFEALQPFPGPSGQFVRVVAANLDGAGLDDVVASDLDNYDIVWFRNLGPAGFEPPRLVAPTSTEYHLAAANIDGVGPIDLVGAGTSIRWYRNEVVADCDGNEVPDTCDIARGASDCDGNGVLDPCDVDCDGSGLPDPCDIAQGAADCDANGLPDACDFDCDANGVPDACDVAQPGADCNDNHVPDACDPDCDANGVPDPCDVVDSCVDNDADGIFAPSDCDDSNAAIWSPPGETGGVLLWEAAGSTWVGWFPPEDPGAAALTYDLLRTGTASDWLAATCLETDLADWQAADDEDPAPGAVFHYLARAENACPEGQGPLGEDSQGVPREGTSCP